MRRSDPDAVVGRSGDVPLARLFAMGYRWMIDELHARLRSRGWIGVRPAYGFVLLAVRGGPLTPTGLAATLEVSKQAASKLADAMVADGLLTRGRGAVDGRSRVLTLAPRGEQLLVAVEAIYAELEGEWAAVIGPAAVRDARTHLTAVLAALHGGALPVVRPTA